MLEWSSYLLFRDFHTSGTAEVQAAAVILSLEECPIVDGVAALGFDNTRQILSCLRPDGIGNFTGNEGGMSGAFTIVEQRLGRDLLFLACRPLIQQS